jgi:hypothetical protein
MTLPDGYAIFVSRDCETCREIEPALRQLVDAGIPLTFVSQDDPGYPEGVAGVIDDRDLELSWRLDIEVTPTAVRITDGNPEGGRVAGWRKSEWEEFFGVSALGPGLAEHRPGCGSATLLPGAPEKLAARFGGGPALVSRRIAIDQSADEYEEIYARGWTDGLPVISPTGERVIRMLGGTRRDPAEIIGVLPPDYAECTVEKAAINAVMAGCLPEYLPVVLAAVESFAADPLN